MPRAPAVAGRRDDTSERATRTGARVATAAAALGLGRPASVAVPAIRLDPGPIDDGWPDPDSYDWGVEAAGASTPADAGTTYVVAPEVVQDAPSDATRPSATDARPAPAPPPAPAPALEAPPAGTARHQLPPNDDGGLFRALDRLMPTYRLLAVILLLIAAVVLSVLVPQQYPLRTAVAVLHVIALVVSFGAVLFLHWYGMLWWAGLRRLGECTRLAGAAEPLVWAGVVGLVVTGGLLRPDLASPLMVAKLVLVAAVVWNAAGLSALRRRLAALPEDARPADLPKRDSRLMTTSVVVSQLGWWGALVIGFVIAASR